MKFFTLIDENKTISLADGKKILPKEEFSILQDAQELVETTRKDVEEYRRKAEEECEKLKEEAKEKGFNEGLEKWAEELARFEEQVKKIQEESQKAVLSVALKAARKIVSREIELNRETVVDIVANTLKAVSHHRKIIIYVHKSDLKVLEKNRPKLKAVLEQVESLSVQEREDIEEGGCVIETEGGIINAQLSNQWRALEKAFQSLMQES